MAGLTDSIKTEVEAVQTVCGRVAEECASSRNVISKSIGANVSTTEVVCHQLCLVAKVKLKYCQGEYPPPPPPPPHFNFNSVAYPTDTSEKAAALADLVDCGSDLLKAVNSLLNDMKTLSDIHPKSKRQHYFDQLCNQASSYSFLFLY